jgi:hypothetical protein
MLSENMFALFTTSAVVVEADESQSACGTRAFEAEFLS